MRMTESNDGERRVTVTVSHRLDIYDMTKILMHQIGPFERITKAKATREIRDFLTSFGSMDRLMFISEYMPVDADEYEDEYEKWYDFVRRILTY